MIKSRILETATVKVISILVVRLMLVWIEIQSDWQAVSRLWIEMLVNCSSARRMLAAQFNQPTAHYVSNTVDGRSLRRCSCRGIWCRRLLLILKMAAAYLLWLEFDHFGAIFASSSELSLILLLLRGGRVMAKFTVWLLLSWTTTSWYDHHIGGSWLLDRRIIVIRRLLLSRNCFTKVKELDLLDGSRGCYWTIAGDPSPCRSDR